MFDAGHVRDEFGDDSKRRAVARELTTALAAATGVGVEKIQIFFPEPDSGDVAPAVSVHLVENRASDELEAPLRKAGEPILGPIRLAVTTYQADRTARAGNLRASVLW